MGRNDVPSASIRTRSTSNTLDGKLDEDEMEKLIKKVCATFFTQIKEELTVKMIKLESKLDDVCVALKDINSRIMDNKKNITELQDRVESLEQKAKANSLRVFGVEESENEDLSGVLVGLFSEKLNINISQTDIDYVFRLRKKKEQIEKTSPIIIHFVSNTVRNRIYHAKKLLRGTPISIFEDLTRNRYGLLMATKRKFGNNMVWTEGGKVYAWDSSTKSKIYIKLNNIDASAKTL